MKSEQLSDPTPEDYKTIAIRAVARRFWSKFMVGDQPHIIPLYERAFLEQATEFAQTILLTFDPKSK